MTKKKGGHATGEGGMEMAVPENVSRIGVGARAGRSLYPLRAEPLHCCHDHNPADAA